MQRHLGVAMFIGAALAACGGGGDSGPDAFGAPTVCGMPGDEGNELGVGLFCITLNDCADTEDARLCSNIGDEETWFCTRTCADENDDAVCGTGAECTCGTGGCGCTPSVCLE
jgi:hypothetical protein